MAFNVQQFRSHISSKNDLSKKYNFEVQVTSPNGGGTWLPMQCESAEIPGKSFVTAEGKIYGPVYRVPYQTQFEPVTLTIVCTNIFDERKYFEDWAKKITTDDFNFNYQPTYCGTVRIRQYDDAGRLVAVATLIDAWPSNIAPMGLDWGDTGYHKLSVQMTYHRYKLT